MPLGNTREKVLYGLARGRRIHPYTIWRWAIAVIFTVTVALLPLTGTLRFDLWGGRHLVGGQELGLVEAAKAFAFPFLAINVLILLATRWLGRYLCGFVCPVGALARIAEWLRWNGRKGGRRLAGGGLLLVFSATLAAISFSFWVDWRVFLEGSGSARALAGGFLLGTTATLFLGARRVGLRFCREWCPSGAYFAVLGHDTLNGIEFAHPEHCTECGACSKVCPMDLEPKHMSGGSHRGGSGVYSDAMSNFALCIRCGDCVKACEATTEVQDAPVPLRMGTLPVGARESSPPDPGDPGGHGGSGERSER